MVRPKLNLTEDERLTRRRQQLAAAQQRRRNKIKDVNLMTDDTSSETNQHDFGDPPVDNSDLIAGADLTTKLAELDAAICDTSIERDRMLQTAAALPGRVRFL